MKIVHMITGLSTGGAEVMLHKLLSGTDRRRFESRVVSLIDRGTIGERIEALGVPVHALGLSAGRVSLKAARILRGQMRAWRPDVIQGWMYHGNLAASLADCSARDARVVWNIRHSVDDLRQEKRSTAFFIRLGAWLSRRPERIVYNSRAAAGQHQSLGYAGDRAIVIPNGFDCDRFKPVPGAGEQLRRDLGLAPADRLIGSIARYHPMKDHVTFFAAAGRLAARKPEVRFVLAGRGVDDANKALADLVRLNGLGGRVRLLGERVDVAEIMSGLDVASLASAYGEGFPNVIGEAMACGVPCAVTDVGDAAWIVGDTGRVVAPRDPAALAAAWESLVIMSAEDRRRLGDAARRRIIDRFSLDRIVAQYEALYGAVVAETRKR